MKDGKEISEQYNQLNIQKKALREEWRQNDSTWKKSFSIEGKKRLTSFQYSVTFIFLIIVLIIVIYSVPIIQSYYMGPELQNDKEYSCPNGDWSGNTSQMLQIGDGYGGVFLYCPLDGKLIGQMTHGMVPGVAK